MYYVRSPENWEEGESLKAEIDNLTSELETVRTETSEAEKEMKVRTQLMVIFKAE